jgi:hypothetical protein
MRKTSRSSREHGYVGVDMFDEEGKTMATDHDDTATVWPQAGNNAKGVRRCGPGNRGGIARIT